MGAARRVLDEVRGRQWKRKKKTDSRASTQKIDNFIKKGDKRIWRDKNQKR